MKDEIQEIIAAYNKLVKGIETKAKKYPEGRAYGGIIRAGKGKLVESMGKILIQIAWEKLGWDTDRLNLFGQQFRIPIRKEYVEKLKNNEIKEFIKQNINNFYYPYKPDIVVSINETIVMAMECKSYTENAMLKRVLVDFTLLKSLFPGINFILLQLESQLGGDYSLLKKTSFGSPSTHTLLSYFDIELHIITLLKGERKVDKPIHKPEFFKPLTRNSLEKAIKVISEIFIHIKNQRGTA
ncbi:MAG: hypothetical protein ACUVQP_10325 [Bacteroidales bacterium]